MGQVEHDLQHSSLSPINQTDSDVEFCKKCGMNTEDCNCLSECCEAVIYGDKCSNCGDKIN